MLICRGVSESLYSNKDAEGVRDNLGGASMERNRSGRGLAVVEGVQEGGAVQDRLNKGFDA